MKKHLQIVLVAVFILFAVSITKAQEWSKEQTEVWKVVKEKWLLLGNMMVHEEKDDD